MRKLKVTYLFILFITLGICASGCTNLQTKKPDGNNSSTLSAPAESNAPSQATSSSANQASQYQSSNATENFMGKWIISKLMFSNPRGSTYDGKTINELIGKKLIFTSETATCYRTMI